jgi:hypothetical protein
MPRPFVLSEQSAQIVRYLGTLEKGTLVTYTELSELVGDKVTPQKTTHPRLMLQRDQNAVWVCVRPRVGLRRLTDVEIAERLPSWWLTGARRKLTRGGKQADVVEPRALDIDQLARFSVDCIQRELAFDALSKAMRNKMERVARGTSNDLPSFNILEWAISLSAKPASKAS